MKKGLKNTLAAAVMLGASAMAANAADASNPEVERTAIPMFSQNLNNSAVVPTGPAFQADKGFTMQPGG